MRAKGHRVVEPMGQTSANSIAVTPTALLGAPRHAHKDHNLTTRIEEALGLEAPVVPDLVHLLEPTTRPLLTPIGRFGVGISRWRHELKVGMEVLGEGVVVVAPQNPGFRTSWIQWQYADPSGLRVTNVEQLLRLRARASQGEGLCRRETPVTVRLADGTLVEGVVDLAFLEGTTWIVVDFKTDRELEIRLEGYRKQVALYRDAISQATVHEAKAFLVRV